MKCDVYICKELYACRAAMGKELDEKRASLCTQTLDNPLLDVRVGSLSLLTKQMLHPRCKRLTRRATTQRPIFDKGS